MNALITVPFNTAIFPLSSVIEGCPWHRMVEFGLGNRKPPPEKEAEKLFTE